MMPLWIYLLVRLAFNSNIDIAWTNLIVALLLIVLPTGLGLYLRHTNTEYKIKDKFIWQWVETFTSIFGFLFLIAALVSAIVIYGKDLKNIPASIWVIGVVMQPVGCLFGYYIAKILGQSLRDQRTISLETGVQNFSLTMAIITLTFKGQEQKDTLMFPLSYGLMYFVNSMLLVAFYRYYLAPQDNDLVATAVAEDAETGKEGQARARMQLVASGEHFLDSKM